MKPWLDRTFEERHLLNPAFCSMLLWYGAKGAGSTAIAPRNSLSFFEAFLILPLVLHQRTRESLPVRVNTSMPVWIDSEPVIVTNLPSRAISLKPYTKEALLFGGTAGLFSVKGGELFINQSKGKEVRKVLKDSSEEVVACMKKAEFLGKWFAHTGVPETIFALLGIRP